MIANAEYDFSQLTKNVSGLTGALLGRGAQPGDLQKVLTTELGQLAGRCGDAVGPKTQAKAMKAIDRDIKSQLTILPRYSNLDEDQQYSSTADFTWLSAGPNFLLGINDEDNQPGMSGADALKVLRAGQKSIPRGNAYQALGQRGKQYVLRLNRVRVSAASMNYVRATLREKTGQLRAAFYRVAVKYVPTKHVPDWIARKFSVVEANGKSSDRESGMGTPEAFIEFTVRAPGVASNVNITAKISGAVQKTNYIVREKLAKILRGYKYDWETGKVFRSSTDDNDFGQN
jgi:hypothetical protein